MPTHGPTACILAYSDWGKLLQSHLLAQDWRREYMAARRGMLSERLRNEHSRARQRWEARPLCHQPHHHLYRAAIRGWAKPELQPAPVLGKTGAGKALEHSSVGRGAGVSDPGGKDLRTASPCGCPGPHPHLYLPWWEVMLSEAAPPSLSAPEDAFSRLVLV